jgi:hypothetical protein
MRGDERGREETRRDETRGEERRGEGSTGGAHRPPIGISELLDVEQLVLLRHGVDLLPAVCERGGRVWWG